MWDTVVNAVYGRSCSSRLKPKLKITFEARKLFSVPSQNLEFCRYSQTDFSRLCFSLPKLPIQHRTDLGEFQLSSSNPRDMNLDWWRCWRCCVGDHCPTTKENHWRQKVNLICRRFRSVNGYCRKCLCRHFLLWRWTNLCRCLSVNLAAELYLLWKLETHWRCQS